MAPGNESRKYLKLDERQRVYMLINCLALTVLIKHNYKQLRPSLDFKKPVQDSTCDHIPAIANEKWIKPGINPALASGGYFSFTKCLLDLTHGEIITSGYHDPVMVCQLCSGITLVDTLQMPKGRKHVIRSYMDVYFKYSKQFGCNVKTIAKTLAPNRTTISGAFILLLCAYIFFILVSEGKYRKRVHFDESLTTLARKISGKTKQWNFLFSLNEIPRLNIQLFPFSLNQYVDDIVKERASAEDLMKYEWSRYLSFKTFPMDSIMTPMRLAQAGFYYTGHGEQVKCFCCGVTNGDWSADESAVEVHKRLSPNCHFIRRESNDNVEIHNKEYYNGMFDETCQSRSSRAPRIESGASGGPVDTVNHISREESTIEQSSGTGTYGSHQGDQTLKETLNQSAVGAKKFIGDMKHPQYADLASRTESFENWTHSDIQNPVELAKAGFFYTGVRDFVRCYCCGVGLKNWEREDDPRAEHARWSNSCRHLLNSRGAREAGEPVGTHSGEQRAVEKQTTAGHYSSSEGSEKPTGANGSTDMDSVAARSLLEMGYSHDQVSEAIRKYRDTQNPKAITARALVDIVETEPNSGKRVSSNSPSASVSSSSAVEQSAVRQSPGNQSTVRQSMTRDREKGGSPAGDKENPQKPSGGSNSGEAKSLVEENESLRRQLQCKICMDRDANVVFLPCGHMVACQTCAVPLRKCAVCRKLIKGSVRVYQS